MRHQLSSRFPIEPQRNRDENQHEDQDAHDGFRLRVETGEGPVRLIGLSYEDETDQPDVDDRVIDRVGHRDEGADGEDQEVIRSLMDGRHLNDAEGHRGREDRREQGRRAAGQQSTPMAGEAQTDQGRDEDPSRAHNGPLDDAVVLGGRTEVEGGNLRCVTADTARNRGDQQADQIPDRADSLAIALTERSGFGPHEHGDRHREREREGVQHGVEEGSPAARSKSTLTALMAAKVAYGAQVRHAVRAGAKERSHRNATPDIGPTIGRLDSWVSDVTQDVRERERRREGEPASTAALGAPQRQGTGTARGHRATFPRRSRRERELALSSRPMWRRLKSVVHVSSASKNMAGRRTEPDPAVVRAHLHC